jgi:hypothetical protein
MEQQNIFRTEIAMEKDFVKKSATKWEYNAGYQHIHIVFISLFLDIYNSK